MPISVCHMQGTCLKAIERGPGSPELGDAGGDTNFLGSQVFLILFVLMGADTCAESMRGGWVFCS